MTIKPSPTPRLCRHGLALLFTLAMAVSGQAAAQRVALLVGNAGYATGRLQYPLRDVAQIKAALLRIGFAEADILTVLDADQRTLKRAMQDFGRRASSAEVAFAYYSGHGAQALGQNWLIPVGAEIHTEAGYDLEAVSAQALIAQTLVAGPRVSVVVLDACRDNPAAVVKSGTKGLSRMDAGDRTLIAFATAPNDTAADTGVYAKVLAAELVKPGQELLDVFRNTTAQVRRITQGRQVPRVSEVTLDERVYLAGRVPVVQQPPAEVSSSQALATAAPAAVQQAPGARPVLEKVTLAADAFFQSGRAEVLQDTAGMLADLVAKTQGVELEVVIAVGHADDRETTDVGAQRLSVSRAEAVKSRLVGLGIERNRVYTEGKGNSQPAADNSTSEGRARNRRVEIEMVGTRQKR